jgi:hypothetical protein
MDSFWTVRPATKDEAEAFGRSTRDVDVILEPRAPGLEELSAQELTLVEGALEALSLYEEIRVTCGGLYLLDRR